MNNSTALVCSLAFTAFAQIQAQTPTPTPLSGSQLSINTYSGNTLSDNTAAIGYNCFVAGYNSLMVGSYAHMSATNSIVAGYANGHYSSYLPGDSAFVVGSYNLSQSNVNIVRSALIGYGNGASNTTITNSLVSGSFNSANVTDGLVAGKNNVVSGQHYVMGQGLIANTNPRMVVLGQYNEPPVSGQLLVVGRGTSGNPENALEIYTDGRVRIPQRQGDILMGDFGDPGD